MCLGHCKGCIHDMHHPHPHIGRLRCCRGCYHRLWSPFPSLCQATGYHFCPSPLLLVPRIKSVILSNLADKFESQCKPRFDYIPMLFFNINCEMKSMVAVYKYRAFFAMVIVHSGQYQVGTVTDIWEFKNLSLLKSRPLLLPRRSSSNRFFINLGCS